MAKDGESQLTGTHPAEQMKKILLMVEEKRSPI